MLVFMKINNVSAILPIEPTLMKINNESAVLPIEPIRVPDASVSITIANTNIDHIYL